MSQSPTDVVVHRRSRVMGLIAIVSLLVAAGYLWRFATTSSPTSLAVGVLVGVIACCYGYAWTDAHLPLLVADAIGVRLRLGSSWTGVPWELIETVEVEQPGKVRDGQVTVVTASSTDVLQGASRRVRRAARLNRWLYDAPLVVPFGLTTRVCVPDITGALQDLARGRAPVVLLNGPEREPAATVEVTQDTTAPVPGPQPRPEPPPVDEPQPVDEPPPLEEPPPADEPPRVEEPSSAQPSRGGGGSPPSKSRRRHWRSRGSGRLPASSSGSSSYASSPARREEVTIGPRTERTVVGSLALAEPAGTVSASLPEIAELRRSPEPEVGNTPKPGPADNVSLIIDATTDLTARAMARTPRLSQVVEGASVPDSRADCDIPLAGTVIGGRLTEARTTLGLSIDELAERTRIRPYVIESIEVDDFSPCGGDFYARGHLRMLARVLGIDAAPLVKAYDDRFATTPVNARAVFEVELATGSSSLVRGTRSGPNWSALAAAVLVLLLVWGVARYLTASTGPVSASGAGAHHSRSGSGSGAVGTPLVRTPPAQAQVKLSASGGGSRVVVRDARGRVLFQGVLADGTAKKFAGRAPLHVRAADAGAVSLSVRGVPLGPVGSPGRPGHRLVGGSRPGAPVGPESTR